MNTDSQAVEIETFGHVAQVLIKKQALYSNEIVIAPGACCRIGAQNAGLVDLYVTQVKHRQETNFVVGWLEDGFALVQNRFHDEVLNKGRLVGVAENIQCIVVRRRRYRDGCRQASCLKR